VNKVDALISSLPARPGKKARALFAFAIGLVAGVLCYGNNLTPWGRPGDFAQSWFGARSLITGVNPYMEVGPGRLYDWPWPLYYPATSFIVAMPFVILSRLWATVLFASISSALLAWSVTQDDWRLTPMFGSAPFIFAAGSAQWSPLFTAAMSIPILALTFAAKPTVGLALAAAGSARVRHYAAFGALVLFISSIVWDPSWMSDWLANVRMAKHIASPLFRTGGVAVLLVLIRWKRPEARLILALACVPQSGAWYEALPLFLVPRSRNEAIVLAISSSVGFLLYYPRMDLVSDAAVNRDVGALIVAFVYLPAIIMVLRRENGAFPPGNRPAGIQFTSRAK